MSSLPAQPSLPATSSDSPGMLPSSSSHDQQQSRRIRQLNRERLARTFSNVMIVGGTVTCLGLAIAAISHVDSESTMVFLLLVPAFFSGGCLLTLVNVSWLSRRPGHRCSLVQVVCNLVLGLMTVYVELLFWPVRQDLALAILFGAALPMFFFINMPSLFMTEEDPMAVATDAYGQGWDAKTVIMDDDEHSLFSVEVPTDPDPSHDEGDTTSVELQGIPPQHPREELTTAIDGPNSFEQGISGMSHVEEA